LQPSIPAAAAWGGATLRAFHPVRWLLSLAGLALTASAAFVLQASLDGQALRWEDWFEQPFDHTETLATQIGERSLLPIIFRLAPFLVIVAGLWCVIAGWVARDELVASAADRRAGGIRPEPRATAFVFRWAQALVTPCIFPVVSCVILLV